MNDSFQMTMFNPESDWVAPSSLPDLSQESVIGFDTETKDPNLQTNGPGFIRGDAYMIGFSIATLKDKWYFPIRHAQGKNLNEEVCLRWLRQLLAREDLTVIAANAMYDMEVCWSEDIHITGEIIDVQIAEPLINEESFEGYSLGVLSKKHLGVDKEETLLIEAAKSHGVNPKSGMWVLDPKYVGPYAEADAEYVIRIWEEQKKELDEQKLWPIFKLEQETQRVLFDMRIKGIPVSTTKAREVSNKLFDLENTTREHLENEWCEGYTLDEWSGPILAQHCQRIDIQYPITNKGNPSFTKDFLTGADHPFLKGISELRSLNRLRKTFVDAWIFGNQINGWIHCEWKQLASDDGGTRTGRLAASNPNPQQIPSRNELAPLIRGCFVPEEGKYWAKIDYSQQEPRILVHFAVLCEFEGAQEAADAYSNDPDMDFYSFMMEVASVTRKVAKDLYLGRCYGMGPDKLAMKLGVEVDEAKEILNKFDSKVPFVKKMADYADTVARQRGYIRTLLGRRRHFDLWEPANSYDYDTQPLPYDSAIKEYSGKHLRRAHTRKALNSLIQGSAADMTKAAMTKVRRELGLLPYMQVHDELNYPVVSLDQAKQVQRIMETCVDMKVPIKADLDFGESWK